MDDILNQINNPQKLPDGGKMSTESLRRLDAVDIAEKLESVLDSMTAENYDAELIDAYLDALEEKSSVLQVQDPTVSYGMWKKRIKDFSAQEGHESVSPQYERRRPRYTGWRRYAAVVAATVGLTFTVMIGAQATGIDIFGNLARWTDEVFTFVRPAAVSSEYYAPFRDALLAHEFPAELAPAWYPEGFQTDGPVYDGDNPFCDSVSMHFSHEDGRHFSIYVDQYFSADDVQITLYEKDAANVELYTSNGRTFYIMTNQNTTTAVWADGIVSESISGVLSVDEVKQIVNSIGG